MSNESILLAKEIFMKYAGSYFHMEREGEYGYYKSFGISKEQERLWSNEYQKELMAKIETEDIVSPLFSKLVSLINQNKDINGLQLLLEVAKRKRGNVDTFTQMRMAEEILDIVESFIKNNEKANVTNEAKKLALDILCNINVSSITIASYYQNIDYLKDVLKEDIIINRVQRLIKRWEK